MTERRSAERYKLSLPIVVDLLAPIQIAWQKGVTKNISVGGVYFLAEQEAAADSPLQLKIDLPSKTTPDSQVFIQARGKVVRVERVQEQGAGRVGIAAVIEGCDIIRTRPPHVGGSEH